MMLRGFALGVLCANLALIAWAAFDVHNRISYALKAQAPVLLIVFIYRLLRKDR